MIVVRAPLSKARHKYFTFLSPEGCTYLQEYLEERIRQREKLTAESPLIAHEREDASITNFSNSFNPTMVRFKPYQFLPFFPKRATFHLFLSLSLGEVPVLHFIYKSSPYIRFSLYDCCRFTLLYSPNFL